MFGLLRNDIADLRRRLRRHPAPFVIISTTLAVVIGVGAAVFAVVSGTMLRPLPFPAEDRLVRVFTMPPGVTESRSRNPLASVDFVRFAERTHTLDRLEVIWQRERSLLGAGDPAIIKAGNVSAGFFDLLGGHTVLGRTFTPAEDEAGSGLVVLGFGLWQRIFAGDPAVLGRTLSIDGEPHVVIGVMTADFQPAYRESELWTPLGVNAHNMPLPNATYLVTVGRLAPGRSLADARGEFTQLMDELGREVSTRRGWSAGVVTLRDYQFGDRRGALLVVAAMAILLVLLAASNVTSLTLARTIARRDEFALRVGLGARWADLVRLVSVEVLFAYGAAALGGLLVAAIGLPLMLSLDPETARAIGPATLDWRVRGGAFLVAALLGCVSGVWPALGALRGLNAGTGMSGIRTTHSRRARRLQASLIIVQTALAMTVLIVGGGLLQTFWLLSAVSPGFEADGLLTAQVRVSSRYATHEQRIAFMDEVLDAVRRNPRIATASSVSSPFIPGFTYGTQFEVENKPRPDGQMHGANFRRIAPGYFETLRIPLLEGRDIQWSDRRTSPWVAVISQSLAKRTWPHQSPIGQRIRRREPGTDWMTVVGIVGDVKDVSLAEGPDPTLYVSQEQHLPTSLPIALVVRVRGDMAVAAPEIRAAMKSVDSTQVVDRFVPMTSYLNASLSSDRFRVVLVGVFAGTGLLLVVIGVYGIAARSIAERTRELGVRLVLGASPSGLWVTTIADVLKAVVVGIAAGMLVAVVAVRLLNAVLISVERPSMAIWATDAALVVALCAVAAGLSSYRVMKIRPMAALT